MRTADLDFHWKGYWYCYTCQFYTGQPEHHKEHDLVKIEICRECKGTGMELN